MERHGEPLTAAGLEPCLERGLGNNLGVAEPQVRELLVTEVLNRLNCRVIVRAVWLAVSELHMLGAEPDELPGAPGEPLSSWQKQSCAYGIDGWLLWTWDTNEQPDLWNAMSDGGVIDQALSPKTRPDPCG